MVNGIKNNRVYLEVHKIYLEMHEWEKWYSLLLLLSSLYVWKYRFEINQLKELNAKNIIFILWIFC